MSVVYGTTANVAGAAIQNFRIGPSLSNRIGTSDSNFEASQVPSTDVEKIVDNSRRNNLNGAENTPAEPTQRQYNDTTHRTDMTLHCNNTH